MRSDVVSIKEAADRVAFHGQSLVSINDLSNEQIAILFDLAEMLETFIGQDINLMGGKLLATIFFEPSTRTRLSFETAMLRLGRSAISESAPLISSSSAKEESLSDMLQCRRRLRGLDRAATLRRGCGHDCRA